MKSSQKSRATVPQKLALEGGKKSWQKISGVSLERFRKWEETEQIGQKGLREELAEVEAEERLK